jgi:transposase
MLGYVAMPTVLLYKAQAYGSQVIIADRRYPSTQRCSQCGNIRAGEDRIRLGESVYHCVQCGYRADRDRNAAQNLEQYPRLEGNWSRKTRTSTDDHTSGSAVQMALVSKIEEVETNL